jgi:hypothetical protein
MYNLAFTDTPMDLTQHRQDVAHALHQVEAAIQRLVDALAHRSAWVSAEDAQSDREAMQRICAAYSTIDYGMEDEIGSSVVCLGVAGVTTDVLKRAAAVNTAKAAFRTLCTPLNQMRMRVPVKGEDGPTKAIPVIRVILRNIQRSDLNLLAAYRKIPILGAPPATITYTRARTRAVYRKSLDELYQMLALMEGATAATDRARLDTLRPDEKCLGVTKAHYDNIRANITYARLDSRGRGRVQLAAELPLLYTAGRWPTPPAVKYPAPEDDATDHPRRTRQSELEPEPFLRSIAAYRYRSRE